MLLYYIFFALMLSSTFVQGALQVVTSANLTLLPVQFNISTPFDNTMQIPECASVLISYSILPGTNAPTDGWADIFALADNYLRFDDPNSQLLTTIPGSFSTVFPFPVGTSFVIWGTKGSGANDGGLVGKSPIRGPYTVIKNSTSSCALRPTTGDTSGDWTTSLSSNLMCGPLTTSLSTESGLEVVSVNSTYSGGTMDVQSQSVLSDAYTLDVSNIIVPGGSAYLWPYTATGLKAKLVINGKGTSACSSTSTTTTTTIPMPQTPNSGTQSQMPSSAHKSNVGLIAGVVVAVVVVVTIAFALLLIVRRRRATQLSKTPPTDMDKQLWGDEVMHREIS
ncbi:hypothetical protein T439DRAFT_330208 [Meredithblackwellia eburnea MCA 4105]